MFTIVSDQRKENKEKKAVGDSANQAATNGLPDQGEISVPGVC